ncbi:MAG TPA: T9SS type A sorting domain-containing protein [Paludibacteraceae bacterium]|nr:T9SS type A sorting domain-containing protein [Paludibacteraceae bacterium]HOL00004.1 T9SS type A sorting domain-containing protein [Paludibacteraceae bacterium]HPO67149.1 T9SS type A sorting domain-containing protein [Paludibacteraceae bacterium]
MKKKTFLFLISLVIVCCAFAQTLPDGMVSLLPSGVKANINDTRKAVQYKNLVVAGEKSKGYKAFFAASDNTHGEELWVTDGTVAGTHMVKDINPGTNGSDINWMDRFNDKVVFAADDGEHGMELWISDGTEVGTYMVKDIHEFGSSNPRGFTQVNETQFIFGAKDFESENYSTRGPQWWLWVSDGTAEGTKMIYDCDTRWPGQDNTSWLSPYCRVGRKVFFKADNKEGTVGEELWVTDGTTEGTVFIKDINTEKIATGTANSAIDNMINFYNEKLFFKAFSIESSNEPWASDGTTEGTYEIYDSNPTFEPSGFPRGGGASDCGSKPYKGKVYFRGFSLETGCELAATNLEQGNFTIWDINRNEPTSNNHSYPDPGVEFDGVYMFCAATGFDPMKPNNYGGELHYTDGETITMQSDMAPGTKSNWVKELTIASGSLYWWNESSELPEYTQKLFRIDNKSQFPVRVTNFSPEGDKIHTLRNLGGDLIFARNDENKSLYVYHYRKEGYDPQKDADDLDIEFRTRAEIESESSTPTIPIPTKIVLYPNPTNDKFNFEVPGNVTCIKIFDISGRLVKEETQLISNSVNVSSLVKGIYKVVITSTEGTYVSSLIII